MLWDRTYCFSSLSEKTRKSNRLQMSLQRQHFLLIYLKTLSVGPAWVRTRDLPLSRPALSQLSQPGGGWSVSCSWNVSHLVLINLSRNIPALKGEEPLRAILLSFILKRKLQQQSFLFVLIFKRSLVLRRFVDRAKPETDAALSWESVGERVRV